MADKKITMNRLYIGINIVLFLIIFIKDPRVSATTLIDFGAQNGFSLADGRLWHLVMPIFLHASWQHLLLNCLSIHIFGSLVERIYGPKNFILISLSTGLIASMGSFLTGTKVAVGASGVVYGYIALHLYLYYLNRDRYKSIFGRDVFILLAFNIIYSVLGANIDLAGHIFGLVGGLFIYMLLDKNKVKASSKRIIALALLLLVLLTGYKIIDYRGSRDYYLSKIYYYEMKNKPIQRDELIRKYLSIYPD